MTSTSGPSLGATCGPGENTRTDLSETTPDVTIDKINCWFCGRQVSVKVCKLDELGNRR
jgi:hypothetical protein